MATTCSAALGFSATAAGAAASLKEAYGAVSGYGPPAAFQLAESEGEAGATDATGQGSATGDATAEESTVGATEEGQPATGDATGEESIVGAAQKVQPATGDAAGGKSAVGAAELAAPLRTALGGHRPAGTCGA